MYDDFILDTYDLHPSEGDESGPLKKSKDFSIGIEIAFGQAAHRTIVMFAECANSGFQKSGDFNQAAHDVNLPNNLPSHL